MDGRTPGTSFAGGSNRPGDPDRRALDAMAAAARRARERLAPGPDNDDDVGERRLVARARGTTQTERPARPRRADVPLSRVTPERRAPRRPGAGRREGPGTRRAVLAAAVAGALVVAGGGLALGLGVSSHTAVTARSGASRRPESSHGVSRRSASPSSSPGSAPGAGTQSAPGAGTQPAVAAPATTPTASPGAPRLTSVNPAAGGPGQRVILSGANLFSADGEVVAYFGPQAAPTSCSSQTSCTATVPNFGSGPSTVPITVTTQHGRSDAVRFAYR